ncbi:MAG: radical SAM protein [candidate division WOR-3 bacterium]|nr:radical SAM protein [candidate division WOR-3 bacterium]
MKKESPEYVRISLAAAMVLGFKNGLFYRNARSPCINILLTYENGCAGNCAYCGLSLKRPGSYPEKSFIRVEWNSYPLEEVIEKMKGRGDYIKRVCVSMITNSRAINDTKIIIQKLKQMTQYPVSVLAAPTILDDSDFLEIKQSGADRLGIAVDACTPELFEKLRGKGVNGPHRWDRYWQALAQAVDVFGRGNVGIHLIVGLGESEKDMAAAIQNAHDQGIETHLFSFFPEPDSFLAHHNPPPAGAYRRIQLARYIINNNLGRFEDIFFDTAGRILKFNIPEKELEKIIDSGKPFMTSGCPGKDGEVACNRPYSDSLPGDDIRNFPFLPDHNDIIKIKRELETYV